MSGPAYTVLNLDLTVQRTDEPIVNVGVPVESIAVLGLPIGTSASLRIGTNKPPVPLLTQGMSIEEICPNNDEGVFLTNALGAGTLVLFIAFGSSVKVEAA